eukprot:scaffold25809_cov122-Cylindrotheca_fusiformis.AAC.1
MRLTLGGSFFSSTWLWLGLLLSTTTTVVATAESEETTSLSSSAQKVLDWIQQAEGGFFNPKQELRVLENSTQSSLGIFAKEDIAKDEILLEVPWALIIKSKDLTEDGQMCCGTVQAVLEEMRLDTES